MRIRPAFLNFSIIPSHDGTWLVESLSVNFGKSG